MRAQVTAGCDLLIQRQGDESIERDEMESHF